MSNNAQDKAIKAAKSPECKFCNHKIEVDHVDYCELWECDYEPEVSKHED